VANGNPISIEPAKGRERRAFSGMCQAVIQSSGQPGTITLNASSPGLREEKLILQSR
jgi:beta-galactosidase